MRDILFWLCIALIFPIDLLLYMWGRRVAERPRFWFLIGSGYYVAWKRIQGESPMDRKRILKSIGAAVCMLGMTVATWFAIAAAYRDTAPACTRLWGDSVTVGQQFGLWFRDPAIWLWASVVALLCVAAFWLTSQPGTQHKPRPRRGMNPMWYSYMLVVASFLFTGCTTTSEYVPASVQAEQRGTLDDGALSPLIAAGIVGGFARTDDNLTPQQKADARQTAYEAGLKWGRAQGFTESAARRFAAFWSNRTPSFDLACADWVVLPPDCKGQP